MEVYDQAYNASLAENERQLHIWRQHLDKHTNLHLETFTESLSVPALIPIGSKILFRGSIVHTNEFMVSLGANYIAKCSLKQAQALLQHRISIAKEKVNALERENEYLTNQLSFTTKHIFSESGQEIIEPYNEEEERKWREKHKVNAKRHRQNSMKENVDVKTCDEIWQSLEELELKEELEQYEEAEEESNDDDDTDEEILDDGLLKKIEEIKEKLKNLRDNREEESCGTEEGLFKRLDQLEEEEELEDELDRMKLMQLDIENLQAVDTLQEQQKNVIPQDLTKEHTDDTPSTANIKKRVSFVEELDEDDDDEPSTIEINFKHDNQGISPKQYQVPSDIYKTHKALCDIKDKPIVPIIKNVHKVKSETHRTEMIIEEEAEEESSVCTNASSVNLLGDVIEHRVRNGEKIIVDSKCVSKFRAMRLERKKKMAGAE